MEHRPSAGQVPPPNRPDVAGTAPLHRVRTGGATPPPAPRREIGPVYTLCLTLLILASLTVLASPDLPRTATVLALVIGAGCTGIVLGRSISVDINGHGLHVQRVQGVTPQQLPHEDDQ